MAQREILAQANPVVIEIYNYQLEADSHNFSIMPIHG